jgi:hypothetical protein
MVSPNALAVVGDSGGNSARANELSWHGLV